MDERLQKVKLIVVDIHPHLRVPLGQARHYALQLTLARDFLAYIKILHLPFI
jgi:hypothetical protein